MIIEAGARVFAVKPIQARAVALVGFGESRELWKTLPALIPIWSLNDAENYGITRIDRAFDMHQIRDIILEIPRWERLKSVLPYPMMMLDTDSRFPSVRKYPLEAALENCFDHIYLGDERAKYLDSSFPYMLALAVLEGYNPIYVYGFEFRSDTEYAYQRVGAALLIGWAAGRGVDIILPRDNALLPPTLYGFEDYQMISRQNLEQFLVELSNQESDWIGRLNIAHAQYIEREKNGGDLESASNARMEAYKQMYMRSGAIQAIRHLIDICDRKEIALQMEDKITVNTEVGV